MKVTIKTIPEISQVELINKSFDDAKEHNANQHDNIPDNLNELCNPMPCELLSYKSVSDADITLIHNYSAEIFNCLYHFRATNLILPPFFRNS